MTYIGLRTMRENNKVFVVFIDTDEGNTAWINLADFQALWKTLRDPELPSDTKIVFKEPSEKFQDSRCATLDQANCFQVYEAEGRIDKNTRFKDVSTFPLDDINFELLDALTNYLMPVDEFEKQLDKMQKRPKIRIV